MDVLIVKVFDKKPEFNYLISSSGADKAIKN